MYVGDETLGAIRVGGGRSVRPAPRAARPVPARGGGNVPRGTGGAFVDVVQQLGAGARPAPTPGSLSGAIGQLVRQRTLTPGAASDTSSGARRTRGGFARLGPGAAPFVMRMSDQSLAGYEGDDLEGLSLKGILKGIGHAATQVGHAVGTAVTSKVGQAIEGGALALTGVGLPAAAGIFAATKGVGNLIKPGGTIGHALTGAAQGAVEGAASSVAGSLARGAISKLRGGGSTPATAATVAQTVATNNLPSMASVAALPAALTPAAAALIPGAVTPAALPSPYQRQRSGYGTTYGAARAVLKGGQAANDVASGAASDAASLAQKALDVAAAAQAASQLGNQAGAAQLAQLAQQISSAAQNVAGGASTAGVDLSALGTAAQGAAGGAVAGGALGGVSQFISDHKGLVYGALAGGAVLAALIFTPRRSSAARLRTA